MGKSWDNTGIAYSVEFWKEVLRVLKPGGFLLSFGGSRTYHRMACAIEDSGFEIRDMVEWVYGSGFPKSLNIGKAIDKIQGNKREIIGEQTSGKILRANGQNERPYQEGVDRFTMDITKGNSKFEGWGTALKPAHEPICMARKPLSEKTVAENVLKYGTGGINIDGSRIPTDNNLNGGAYSGGERPTQFLNGGLYRKEPETFSPPSGRFPANLIHDGSPEVVAMFPSNAGAAAPVASGQKGWGGEIYGKFAQGGDDGATFYADKGSAARFFYCAKASGSERNMGCDDLEEKDKQTLNNYANPSEGRTASKSGSPSKNHHPTVKPIALMKYLVKLVTPPSGIVYDPFAGSGSTLVACKELGFDFIGSELQSDYCQIATARLSAVVIDTQLTLL